MLGVLQAQPLVLPLRECPGALVKATRMIGQRIAEFRSAVIETLPTTLGCMHLNNVLRARRNAPARTTIEFSMRLRESYVPLSFADRLYRLWETDFKLCHLIER